MALTIGELTGYITFDASGVEEGVNVAESRMRTLGSNIADAAAHAGEEAGEDLGSELADNAVEELRGAQGEFATAGQQAGDAFGDGMAQGADGAAEQVNQSAEGAFSKLKMAAVAAGVAAGAALMVGIGEALEQGKIEGRLGAQLGATPAEAHKYGKIAGKMYADAVTEDFQGAADAIKATMASGLLPSGATEAQIQSISTKVSDLASTFELDLGQSANAVGQLMKNKLAPDAQTAIDIMTRGMQVMGPRADDLADTFNEYSPIFQAMGFSAQQATGLLAQGMRAGARDTDTVADAIKEFSIRAIDGSKTTVDAFQMLGLSHDKMQQQFGKGGKASSDAFQLVLDKIRAMKDPVEQNAAMVGLFGTKAEDMRATLLSLNPGTAVSALGQVGGAADKVGESLRANAGVQIEQFKRKAEEAFVHFVGGAVVPKLNELIEKVKEFKNSPEFDKLVQFGHNAWIALGQVVTVVKDLAVTMSPLVTLAMGLGGAFLSWLADMNPSVLTAIATALGLIFLAVKTYTTYVALAGLAVRAWAIAQGIFNTVMMLNPIGLVIAAVVALVAAFVIAYQKSETFRDIVQGVWSAIKSAIGSAIDWIKGVFNWFSELPEKMGRWWQETKVAVVTKALEIVEWITGLPGRIWNGIKNFGSMIWTWATDTWEGMKRAAGLKIIEFIQYIKQLPGQIVDIIKDTGWRIYNAGQDIVKGLWDGIKSMGQWIKQTLINWALAIIPGPIAKALGIASPSKLMAKEVGRWIPAGIVQGIQSGQGAVDSTMAGLVTPPVRPGLGTSNTASATPTIRIELAGPQEMRALIRSIVQKNGGNVQQVFT